jgi:hypothetical protein
MQSRANLLKLLLVMTRDLTLQLPQTDTLRLHNQVLVSRTMLRHFQMDL